MKSMNRRTALLSAVAAAGTASLTAPFWFSKPAASNTDPRFEIQARPKRTALGGAVRPFDRWIFDTGVAGSLVRGRVGEMLNPQLVNNLEVPTTIHWHGLRVSKGMDGVTGKFASPLIQPGEAFEYEVPLRDPGTHWFHSHHDSLNQIARGLYGPLVVENPDEPALFEQVMVLDDWTVTGTGPGDYEIDWAKLKPGLAWGHAGVKGRLLTINGSVKPRLELAFKGSTRLRMLNAATGRVFRPSFENARAWVIALDGYTCQPFELTEPLFFGPGQRIDLLVEPTPTGRPRMFLGESLFGKGTSFAFSLGVENSMPMTEALPAFTPYAPAELLPETRPSQSIELNMSEPYRDHPKGAGKVSGQWQNWDTVVNNHHYWLFNDVADNGLGPLFKGRVGETVEVQLLNNSATHHVMHFHGQHVQVLNSSSAPHEVGKFRDGLTLEAWSNATLGMRLDRPGLWPLHCHILGHQVSGMFTYYEVA